MSSAKVWTSFAWMHLKYVTQKKTEQEIAKEAGTSQATINRWLQRHGLKKDR